MYPLTDLKVTREVNYVATYSPIKGTAFESMVTGSLYESGDITCLQGPVRMISSKIDTVLRHDSCKNLAKYTADDKHDSEELLRMLKKEFGEENID